MYIIFPGWSEKSDLLLIGFRQLLNDLVLSKLLVTFSVRMLDMIKTPFIARLALRVGKI